MSVSSSRVARAPYRKRRRRRRKLLPIRLRRFHQSARRIARKLCAAPPATRIVILTAVLLALLPMANLVYQVVRKPSEIFFPVSGTLNKMPEQTWRRYGPLFREYSTETITPELLAALAQVESAGNPVARTYWRWRLSLNPFEVYRPASSAVGMFQMTDAAFEEARRYCIRRNAVEDGCWHTGLYTRVLPSHAIELASIYLDRYVATILAGMPRRTVTPRQKQDLAAIVHVCGPGRAAAVARRGFRILPGERCGDHDIAAYLARVDAMRRIFLRFAAAGGG